MLQEAKYRIVALSTVESEYVAMNEVTQEVIWSTEFLRESGQLYHAERPCVVFCDNQGAISISKNDIVSNLTKHINPKYHFVKDCVKNEILRFTYISTCENIADCFTKALGCTKIRICNERLGLN